MPRVYKVAKTRKDQGTCGRCGCEIKKGDPYLYWEFRIAVGKSFRSDRRIRCTKVECYPKPSDLTQSEFWRAVYSLQERGFESDDIEGLESERDEVIDELNNLVSELQEKLDNMPEGLQQGDTGQMLQDRIETLSAVSLNLEAADIVHVVPDKEKDETDEAYEERKGEALKECLEGIKDELSAALSNISCS